MTLREILQELVEIAKPAIGIPDRFVQTTKIIIFDQQTIAYQVTSKKFTILKPFRYLHGAFVLAFLLACLLDIVGNRSFRQELAKNKINIILSLYIFPSVLSSLILYFQTFKYSIKPILLITTYYMSFCLVTVYLISTTINIMGRLFIDVSKPSAELYKLETIGLWLLSLSIITILALMFRAINHLRSLSLIRYMISIAAFAFTALVLLPTVINPASELITRLIK